MVQGFESLHHCQTVIKIASLVQSVERWTVNPCVTGSSPVGSAKDSRLAEFWLNALPSVELILILQCINYMP